jgi:ABC-type nitrate/sulfonate/bicarbonate transport system substrate-binding protein
MNKSIVANAFLLIAAFQQFFFTPTAFAQLIRLKTSYSALTANMAAYWLAKETKTFEKHGLNVDVVLIESGVTTVQALTAGETQSLWAAAPSP